ncbi:MAG: putative toxin-antitoxin system toxin component, PIN family [Chitinophagaceae bacterium]|nr:putative toxin-antitoxin system toxin component, PIN family [Chitinophagaceae bacterium]
MRVKRFVLDANIWISYIITGNENRLLKLKADNKLTFLICEELIVEIKRVLEYPQIRKYRINTKDALRFIRSFTILIKLEYPIGDYLPADPDDNYVIALALQANAGFVTSGDRHILSQKKVLETKYKKLRIITKAGFEKMFL